MIVNTILITTVKKKIRRTIAQFNCTCNKHPKNVQGWKDLNKEMKNRLDVKHPKNVQGWKELDEEMKNKLKKGADLFVENVYPIIKKLSKE